MGFTQLQIEQNPWLGGYHLQNPILSTLCPQLNLLNPPKTKFIGMPLHLLVGSRLKSGNTELHIHLGYHNALQHAC
jgi:hypothetical protein